MLADKLNECKEIKDWLFDFHEGHSLKLGLRDSELGGPYKPPSTAEIYGGGAHDEGKIYIKWTDGSVSKGKINAQTFENLNKAIENWKGASYFDKDAAEVIEPQPIPDVKIMDGRIKDTVYGDSSYLFETLKDYMERMKQKQYVKTLDGWVAVSYVTNTIRNSRGMNHVFDSTKCDIAFIVNDSVGYQYLKRKLPWKKNLNHLVKAINFAMSHRDKKADFKGGMVDVILIRDEINAFVNTFILENLDGSNVANESSAYSLHDFSGGRQVFREDINLVVDGLRKWSKDTSPCTMEGVPSRKQMLIANGKLVTPELDLKYSRKLGMPPTPPGEIVLDVEKKYHSLMEMIKDTEKGIFVAHFLGMHTQSPKEGDYSLPIVLGFLIEEGKIKGAIEGGVMAGNFFKDLNDPKTVFGSYGDGIIMRFKSTYKR